MGRQPVQDCASGLCNGWGRPGITATTNASSLSLSSLCTHPLTLTSALLLSLASTITPTPLALPTFVHPLPLHSAAPPLTSTSCLPRWPSSRAQAAASGWPRRCSCVRRALPPTPPFWPSPKLPPWRPPPRPRASLPARCALHLAPSHHRLRPHSGSLPHATLPCCPPTCRRCAAPEANPPPRDGPPRDPSHDRRESAPPR